jgi:hypothetical protein
MLDGRSQRTRALADRAGIEEVAGDTTLVRAADIVLAILVPAQAIALAIAASGARPVYVDCNAIAPETTRQIAELIEGAGARFVDAGIIGPPPKPGASMTRFYASGPDAEAFARLGDFGLDVRVVGDRPGQASALKMCYAALTKGTTALMTQHHAMIASSHRNSPADLITDPRSDSQRSPYTRKATTVIHAISKRARSSAFSLIMVPAAWSRNAFGRHRCIIMGNDSNSWRSRIWMKTISRIFRY